MLATGVMDEVDLDIGRRKNKEHGAGCYLYMKNSAAFANRTPVLPHL